MNIREKYPYLTYFLRCYFNQDFEVLFGNADETLTAYKTTETVEEQLQLKVEIDYLLDLSLSDNELQDLLLNEIDCGYYYPNEWPSSEEWLKHISKQIK
ncbi:MULTISPECIES: contact-dependent growth inhibition system immunity protein [Lelliottia]|uniref:Contact-dependent growth inhibition system immunity protein n=1 Tax=Lelliottia wanjuensis TaxID=3050585 RepID=A0AAP4CZG5_9ENTR|nr:MULTISPECIES: contact-dependent growth inhibition system immunity protein [unclassified Lelliottia]MDK9357370.1 contact-dependent growth inhibition system immunity protein [Lelliottia sp. V106_16]MDK9362259.1 contact-dependent growth inhibition system immunity protein [Lelliottia sp. V106_12]MDK9373138.1 contact-dependent growth inhibition system immunity protein [Lelliottia sp. V106_10]MDK9586558.1 contact-dependent growth inhibition system immunity protein [Lelliottia sp. V86_10]MDK959994